MKRAKKITKEQQEYRDSIVLPKRKVYKKRIVIDMPLPEPITRETYMQNCLKWISWYYERRCEKERALKAAYYLKQYCEEIIRELNS